MPNRQRGMLLVRRLYVIAIRRLMDCPQTLFIMFFKIRADSSGLPPTMV